MTQGEIRAEWVRRLRDPEAKQTTGALCRVEPFCADGEDPAPIGECCLGVLCRIAVDEGIIPKPIQVGGMLQFGEGDDCNRSVVPMKVQKWVGLKSSDGEHQGIVNTTLASENDHGLTFNRIANIIEDGDNNGLFV